MHRTIVKTRISENATKTSTNVILVKISMKKSNFYMIICMYSKTIQARIVGISSILNLCRFQVHLGAVLSMANLFEIFHRNIINFKNSLQQQCQTPI